MDEFASGFLRALLTTGDAPEPTSTGDGSTNSLILGVVSALALVLAPVLTALIGRTRSSVNPGGINAPAVPIVPAPAVPSHVPELEFMNIPMSVLVLNKMLGEQASALAKAQAHANKQDEDIAEIKADTEKAMTVAQQRLTDLETSHVSLVGKILSWGIWGKGDPPRQPPDEWLRYLRAHGIDPMVPPTES